MLNKKNLFRSLVISATLIFSQFIFANPMSLDEEMSSLNFFSIKKGSVGETHFIKKLTGSLSDKGELKISIYLGSVETHIPIRNTRMKRHVFLSEQYPLATITANVSDRLPFQAGVSVIETKAELTMLGIKKEIDVSAIVALTGSELVVSSMKPIIIRAADYGMDKGIQKLQELAKLPSIATAVPVNFSLVFK